MACGGRNAQKRSGAEKCENGENVGISPNLVKFSTFCSFPRNGLPEVMLFLGRQARFAPGAENDQIYPNFTKFLHFHKNPLNLAIFNKSG